jgi:hypothetical protein
LLGCTSAASMRPSVRSVMSPQINVRLLVPLFLLGFHRASEVSKSCLSFSCHVVYFMRASTADPVCLHDFFSYLLMPPAWPPAFAMHVSTSLATALACISDLRLCQSLMHLCSCRYRTPYYGCRHPSACCSKPTSAAVISAALCASGLCLPRSV